MREKRIRYRSLWRVGLCAMAALVLFPGGVLAARPALPPRPTPAPILVPRTVGEKLRGNFIELQVQPAAVAQAAVVQWQDGLGEWHDVDGWKAGLGGESQRWWVDQKDFGTGPFRWLVYGEGDGEAVGSSAPFYLPAAAYELLVIPVGLEQ